MFDIDDALLTDIEIGLIDRLIAEEKTPEKGIREYIDIRLGRDIATSLFDEHNRLELLRSECQHELDEFVILED